MVLPAWLPGRRPGAMQTAAPRDRHRGLLGPGVAQAMAKLKPLGW